jgi:hypothetical protein
MKMNSFLQSWKSTAAGVLSFLLTTLTTVSAFMGAGDLAGGGTIHTNTKVVVGFNIATALCRAWIGFIQQDADKTLAKVPGTLEPQVVAAHPMPDDVSAIPVVDASKK